ncbi:unnamed protein product [Thelazia callipaeda]|uniref:Apple domain-containing protein n=1 Tax=Thelazia callipaeda TaxID=103827 RepID=A0A0N5D3G0_THECL|nr:unnamed protein product [Thelazia callipaeda]
MKKCDFFALALCLLLSYSKSQKPNGENELDFDDQKVVTLGPPRDGFQRAIFDEVAMNDINRLSAEDITLVKNDIGAYDDKFVDLREEEPLFIPKAYRNDIHKGEKTKSTVKVNRVVTDTPPKQGNTLARTLQSNISRTSLLPLITRPPVTTQLPFQSPQTQFFLRPQFSLRPPISPPRIITQQQLPTRISFRPQIIPKETLLFPQSSQFFQRQQHFRNGFIFTTPQPTLSPLQSASVGADNRQGPLILPVRSRQQPSRLTIRPPISSLITSDSLRTGVCHASIFYISTPMQGSTRNSFTHFAITVSVDQCARTCHEFNCAIAHYDPSTGHCQFNPSTAFSIREGQCPPWPATHYKNNVRSTIPLRIFCVQCHRPIRRGRISNTGNRFRTAILNSLFTGRLSNSLRGRALARAHSVPIAHPDVIFESSVHNTDSQSEEKQQNITQQNHKSWQELHRNSSNQYGHYGTNKKTRHEATDHRRRSQSQTNRLVMKIEPFTRSENER